MALKPAESQQLLGSSPGHEPLQELQTSLLSTLLGLANTVLTPVINLLMHLLILHVLICVYAGKVNSWEVLPRDVQGPPAVAWTGACNADSSFDSGHPTICKPSPGGPPAENPLLKARLSTCSCASPTFPKGYCLNPCLVGLSPIRCMHNRVLFESP